LVKDWNAKWELVDQNVRISNLKFWLTKEPISENDLFGFKDSIGILKGLNKFIECLITREMNF